MLVAMFALIGFIAYGAMLGIRSQRQFAELQRRIDQLERQLQSQSDSESYAASFAEQPSNPQPVSVQRSVSAQRSISAQRSVSTQKLASQAQQPKDSGQQTEAHAAAWPQGYQVKLAAKISPNTNAAANAWWSRIRQVIANFPTGDQSTNALFWLGGIVLTFGGLFLAKYTLEAGLLSPLTRVLLGFMVGIGFIAAAEYLTRKKEALEIHSDYLCAALVSAGVITCYAMTLVASHYYLLISSGTAFVMLAIIALTATAMTLRYGPIVAVIGILGAYSVPFPFWSFNDSLLTIAGYIVLVSASAIVVANRVRRPWLWWLSFCAHFSWLLGLIALSAVSDAWIIVLFALISIYLYVLSDVLGWRLQQGPQRPLSLKVLFMPRKEQAGLLASLLPVWLFYVVHGYQPSLIVVTVLLLALLCSGPLRHSAFDTWPLLGWLLSIATWWMLLPQTNYTDLDFMFSGAHLYSQAIALALFSYALWMQHWLPKRLAFSLLLVIGPTSLFALSYIFSPPQANLGMYSLWAVELLVLALIAERITAQQPRGWVKLSGILLANLNISLILTMLLESSTLTLALSLQLIGLGYWCQRLTLTPPQWLVKVLLAVLLIRLTLFPWLDEYQNDQVLGVHWTLIVYPLILIILAYARRYYQDSQLRQIIAGAMLHVVALLVTTESSYQLVGHYPDFSAPSFKEAILLAMNWLIMATVYAYRSQYSRTLRPVYLGFAALLTAGSALYHIALLTTFNPWFSALTIGNAPLWNWMLPLWLIPALLLLAAARLNLLTSQIKPALYGISALWLLLFINGTIRHAFHQDMIWLGLPTEQLEMYTYSLVWLLISVLTLIAARRMTQPALTQTGFIVLAAVVCKAFLIDMSQLTGLYRALSFLGLGLSLLGVGWLFQRMKTENNDVGR